MRKTILGFMLVFATMLMVCCKSEGNKTKTIDELMEELAAMAEDSTATTLSHEQIMDMSNMVDTFLFWRNHESSEESRQYYMSVASVFSHLFSERQVASADEPLVDAILKKMDELCFRFELVGETDSLMTMEHIGMFLPKNESLCAYEVKVAFEFSKYTGLVTRVFCTLPDIFPADKAPEVAFCFGGGECGEEEFSMLTFDHKTYVKDEGWKLETSNFDTEWLRLCAYITILCHGEGDAEFQSVVGIEVLKEQLASM